MLDRSLQTRLQSAGQGKGAAGCRLGKDRARAARLHAYKLSRGLVAAYRRLALGDLNVAGLKRLSRSMHAAAWRQLVEMCRYRASNAGGEVHLVDSRDTSQTCPALPRVRGQAALAAPAPLRMRV